MNSSIYYNIYDAISIIVNNIRIVIHIAIWEIGKAGVPTDFRRRRALAHTVGRALNESTQDLLPRPLGTPRYLRYASDMESELLTSPTPRPPDRSN